ncbi:MAG TPA: hypothetical protein PLI68_12575, partial [Bacteroidia bacterium]|nr:hypothetical protein [Bacteroidia bacterium]
EYLFIALQTQISRHPRCKRGRVEGYKRKHNASALQTRTSGGLLRCKRKFFACALQTRTSWV